MAARAGLPGDAEIVIEIDESHPLGRAQLTSTAPITIAVQGGAFEDLKRPRVMSEEAVVSVLGRLLFRAADRLGPGFDDAPPDNELTLRQHVAWDAYAVGRCEQAGYRAQKGRRRYHFRLRHGFTDAADAAFDRLWSASDLAWADIDAISIGA